MSWHIVYKMALLLCKQSTYLASIFAIASIVFSFNIDFQTSTRRIIFDHLLATLQTLYTLTTIIVRNNVSRPLTVSPTPQPGSLEETSADWPAPLHWVSLTFSTIHTSDEHANFIDMSCVTQKGFLELLWSKCLFFYFLSVHYFKNNLWKFEWNICRNEVLMRPLNMVSMEQRHL